MPSSLLLVDALNIAYRAYYAITALATSAGSPTNAVYGFIKTFMQLERLWSPSHRLVVFDGGTPAERLELLATYKAQRPVMPGGLRAQLPVIEAWLDAAAIAHVRLEKQEADDVIASVAVQAAGAGFSVLMASGDKDLLQVVSPAIAVVAPGKAEEKIGSDGVLAKTGVRPDQVVDWLALTGDSSDNIPGVPGIGAKTAARLLGKWQTIANAFSHIDGVEPEKTRQSLQENRELLERNRKMLSLQKDLDCGISLAGMQAKPPDTRGLLAFYDQMEFHTLARALREPMLF